jgi:hypothetical protein
LEEDIPEAAGDVGIPLQSSADRVYQILAANITTRA